ncbi:serine/threonine protein kinase [Rhodovarius crocodyli]|uniref:Serine/threonine protein kinase n=1 Tax=Rhodovarius crocodyli TaxID=1979269 RepID=A0A437MEP2_9PROT|nr:serine/threonine-protein kinase [Rhodovarius crocodyli]RVT96092.1 serine/threonine protein kinase [Rhodovarius crocodyli]
MPQDSSFDDTPPADRTLRGVPGSAGMIGALVADRYEIRDQIGKGAFGTVFEAYDRSLSRLVALKTMPLAGTNQDELLRFYREGKALARLSHPGIVSVHDFGEMPDFAWIVMELVIGETLRDVLGQGRLPLTEALRIEDELLTALQAAHDRGIVHRDVKPANILLASSMADGFGHVRMVDFGIARVGATDMTVVGDMLGTPYSMAPEQLDHADITPRTDVWAAGVVLYEMLTGVRPFPGQVPAIFSAILRLEPPAPSSLVEGLPPALDGVVARALAKRPEDRFESAAAMAAALRAAMLPPEEPLQATPRQIIVPPPAPPPAAPRRRWWPVLLALLVGAGVGGAKMWWYLGAPDLLNEEPADLHSHAAAPADDTPEPEVAAAPRLEAAPEPAVTESASATPEPEPEPIQAITPAAPPPVITPEPAPPAPPPQETPVQETPAPAPAALAPEAPPAAEPAPPEPPPPPPEAVAPAVPPPGEAVAGAATVALPACTPAQMVSRSAPHATYQRLVLEWRAPTAYRLARQGDEVSLTFPGAACMPTDLRLPSAIRSATPRDGALLLQLAPGTQLRHFRLDNRIVMDLSPARP